MGIQTSAPECNMPTRTFVGLGNARSIVTNCAKHRIAFALGFVVVLSLGIMAAHIWTKEHNPSDKFQVPLWLAALPIAFFAIYAYSQVSYAEQDLQTEELYKQLSGMSKKDFLNYRVGDDRANKSFAASAMSSSILASSSIMGPFLRSDR